jgi:hypothetical protein
MWVFNGRFKIECHQLKLFYLIPNPSPKGEGNSTQLQSSRVLSSGSLPFQGKVYPETSGGWGWVQPEGRFP